MDQLCSKDLCLTIYTDHNRDWANLRAPAPSRTNLHRHSSTRPDQHTSRTQIRPQSQAVYASQGPPAPTNADPRRNAPICADNRQAIRTCAGPRPPAPSGAGPRQAAPIYANLRRPCHAPTVSSGLHTRSTPMRADLNQKRQLTIPNATKTRATLATAPDSASILRTEAHPGSSDREELRDGHTHPMREKPWSSLLW